jgi:hypothetical protein
VLATFLNHIRPHTFVHLQPPALWIYLFFKLSRSGEIALDASLFLCRRVAAQNSTVCRYIASGVSGLFANCLSSEM